MKGLGRKEKQTLLKLARRAIERYIQQNNEDLQKTDEELLKTLAGAFVTLESVGELRGCIGQIEAKEPLEQVVQKMAIAAATRDPRFPAVKAEEFDQITIEISVISPFRTIKTPDEIEVGRDGLMITDGVYSGLLLPQVASERLWDSKTFLSHTCLKAGLPMDHWKTGQPKIEAFSAQVFSERDF